MTTTISKRRKAFANKVDRAKAYAALDAMKLVKETATAKFDESVDVAVNLGIDAKKSDQTVRGSVLLPAGTGKKVRVAVFAQGDKAQAAKAAGAELVGMEDLAETIKGGSMEFDVVIAAPDAMRIVGQLGQILGPVRARDHLVGRLAHLGRQLVAPGLARHHGHQAGAVQLQRQHLGLADELRLARRQHHVQRPPGLLQLTQGHLLLGQQQTGLGVLGVRPQQHVQVGDRQVVGAGQQVRVVVVASREQEPQQHRHHPAQHQDLDGRQEGAAPPAAEIGSGDHLHDSVTSLVSLEE